MEEWIVGCLAFIGENNTRGKELWTWEEAIQGSHETQLRNNAIILSSPEDYRMKISVP